MSRRINHNQVPFVKIVYSKEKINGKVTIVPLELYADGTLRRCA